MPTPPHIHPLAPALMNAPLHRDRAGAVPENTNHRPLGANLATARVGKGRNFPGHGSAGVCQILKGDIEPARLSRVRRGPGRVAGGGGIPCGGFVCNTRYVDT